MGRAVAVRLARQNASLALLDIDESGLRDTGAEVARAGGRHIVLPVDITRPDDVARAVQSACDEFGPPHVGALAAGHYMRGVLLQDLGFDDLHHEFAINLFGVIYQLRALLRMMIASSTPGHVVLWSSTAARLPHSGISVYAAAKGAIESLTRAVAADVAEYGITVNAVSPGPVNTPMLAYMTSDEKARAAESVPLGRLGSPDDVASLVAWLASAESSWVTGAVFPIDGGRTAISGAWHAPGGST